MVDLENLAVRPEPFFKQAQASSYDRDSHHGGDAWFANRDVGQYVRTETTASGRREHVLADLKGPGTVTRFWSANPDRTNTTRFYFDGESEPRLALPLADLFKGLATPFGPDYSYVSGTGGNLYFPLPYAVSLRITVEEPPDSPIRLYYEIGHRTYDEGTHVETFDPATATAWEKTAAIVAAKLAHPGSAARLDAGAGRSARVSDWVASRLTVVPGETASIPDPRREVRLRMIRPRPRHPRESRLERSGARPQRLPPPRPRGPSSTASSSIESPLGDFFGSGPGVNPYENLFFTVDGTGR